MKIRIRFDRSLEIQKIRRDLERDGVPRLQMALLVALTGIAGFVASYILLGSGLVEMWLRYLAAFGVAYLTFLIMLWFWMRTRADDYVDLSYMLNAIPSGNSSAGSGYTGNGGNFGGGGASTSFDAPDVDISGDSGAGDIVGEAVSAAAQAEELAIPLVALILIGSLLLSILFMIYSAPVLFAELLVDGVLSASLYRKLRGLDTHHWLETAIRRTVWPYILTAFFVSACGWAMSLYAPEAHTVRDVILHARHAY